MIASVFQQSATTYTIVNEDGSWGPHIYCPNGQLAGHTASTVCIHCPNENRLKIFNESGRQVGSTFMPRR